MSQFACIIGTARERRTSAARVHAAGLPIVDGVPPAAWPFDRRILPEATGGTPLAILLPDLHLAFPAGQSSGTRLVLTQSTYQLQRWLDWLAVHPRVRVIAHANGSILARWAPEAAARRGPWSQVDVTRLGDEASDRSDAETLTTSGRRELHDAFREGTPQNRLAVATRASVAEPGNAALQLALGSIHMELQELEPAQQAITRALEIAPDWEAVWFEYGKLWLRADDLQRAAERFAEAARLMPTFAAALSNLGAALAETERPGAAIEALQQALRHDPEGYPILNNLAVIYREQGRLDEAVEASRRVVALAPQFVFGYYNLGHALFLQGQFDAARDAYESGQRRDPHRNPVQACRLAVARAAAGEHDRAIDEIDQIADAAAPDVRVELMAEAEATLEALLASPYRSDGLIRVLERVRQRRT